MGDLTLREEVARAMWDAREATVPERTRQKFDAGTHLAKGCTVLMADAAIAVVLERLREPWERVEKAHVAALKSKGEILGEATLHPDDLDELGNAIFAVHQLLYALAKEQQG